MLPRTVTCDECGHRAAVRGYGRVEHVWGPNHRVSTVLKIKVVRLTIDCPRCGVITQEHRPGEHGAV